jgi:hypothetical protein
MHNPQPTQGHNPCGENPNSRRKDGRTDGWVDGRMDGQTTQNSRTNARKDGLADDLIENNPKQPHDDTMGTKRSDGKTLPEA